ncbi:MAG: hypothetical protein K2X47_13170 [Bdellovibrionales bacterium]|nr:hypothetical protein [Bdellovibrionales bacterium]
MKSDESNTGLTTEEKSFEIWYGNYLFRHLDSEVGPFLNLVPSHRQWLRGAREALFFSGNEIAKRLGISRSAYYEMEAKERSGALTINNLDRFAKAMECEVVYAVRPRRQICFSKVVWEQLFPKADEIEKNLESEGIAIYSAPDKLADYRIRRRAIRSKFLLEQSRFRKQQNWSVRYRRRRRP